MAEFILVADRDERFALFWKWAEEDENKYDAPPAMRRLIAGENPVRATKAEVDEALAWCEGRVGWMPATSRRPSLPGDVQWPARALPRRPL
jgi:hypothetical protein